MPQLEDKIDSLDFFPKAPMVAEAIGAGTLNDQRIKIRETLYFDPRVPTPLPALPTT